MILNYNFDFESVTCLRPSPNNKKNQTLLVHCRDYISPLWKMYQIFKARANSSRASILGMVRFNHGHKSAVSEFNEPRIKFFKFGLRSVFTVYSGNRKTLKLENDILTISVVLDLVLKLIGLPVVCTNTCK